MLTKEENFINFMLWKGQAYLNLLPLEIDEKDGSICPQKSFWRNFYFKIFYLLEVSYFVYVAIRLIQSLIHPDMYMIEHHFPCHFCCTFLFLLGLYKGYTLLIKKQDLNIAVFNEIFRDQDAEGYRNWKEYSRQELFAIGHIVTQFTQWAGMMVLFASDGSQWQMLYSVMPLKYQNPFTFISLFLADQLIIIGLFVLAGFAENVQIHVFLKCETTCHEIGRRLVKCTALIVPSSFVMNNLMELRRMALMIRLFNNAHATILFGVKLFCMTMGTQLIFSTIRLFENHPLLSTIYLVFAADFIILYCIVYERAGCIPQITRELKNQLLLLTSRIPISEFSKKKEILLEVQSMQNIGIRVGNFHTLERHSTPKFVDFVIVQVTGLLVTFR